MAMPAEPILAANILESRQRKGTYSSDEAGSETEAPPLKVATNFKAIDDVLDGGLHHGEIHCIIPAAEQDTRELIYAILVSHLRSSRVASAAFIECTSSFDVRELYQALDRAAANDGGTSTPSALQTLEQLKIMKVFDYVGLSEAVSEVQENMDKTKHATTIERPQPAEPQYKSTIPDSDSEDDELDDTHLESKQPPHIASPPMEQEPEPRGLLIIDNIAQLFAPLIKNNFTTGQAALASFMRQLSHVTRGNRLCTILVCHASNRLAVAEDSPSLFASCTVQPALGAGFASLVDVMLYLHSVPAKKASGAVGNKRPDRVMASVLEVVQDRYGARYGRWAAFLRGPERRLINV